MSLVFLLQFVLPTVALLAGAAQSVAHAFIAARHQPDHPLLIDKVVQGVVAVMQALPKPQNPVPTASETP